MAFMQTPFEGFTDPSPYSGATARDLHPLPYSPRLCGRGTRTLLDKKSCKKFQTRLILLRSGRYHAPLGKVKRT